MSLIAPIIMMACSDNRLQRVECNRADVPVAELATLDHEVNYNAFNSTFLRPEVAKLYGIDRDQDLGVVMVSVYQKRAPGVGVEVCVSGGATNILGQVVELRFDEVREGEAIYHIGTFGFTQEEALIFKVHVEIADTGATHELKWQQKFWSG